MRASISFSLLPILELLFPVFLFNFIPNRLRLMHNFVPATCLLPSNSVITFFSFQVLDNPKFGFQIGSPANSLSLQKFLMKKLFGPEILFLIKPLDGAKHRAQTMARVYSTKFRSPMCDTGQVQIQLPLRFGETLRPSVCLPISSMPSIFAVQNRTATT